MSIDAFIERWRPCLGTVLRDGRSISSPIGGVELDDFDILEIKLEFGEGPLVRYLDYEQADESWQLSVREATYLTMDSFPDMRAEQGPVLLPAIGRKHTALDLYSDSIGNLKALALHFGAYCFIIALGNRAWNAEKQETYFNGFHGEELWLL